MKTRIGIFIFLLFIFGCATPPIAMNYSPSSLLTSNASINVGNFTYLPFLDKKVGENEIRTTAAGYFKIESPISSLISNAIKLEFKFVGMRLDNLSNKILTGEINTFIFDDLGFSVDIALAIKYTLKKNDKICISKEIVTQKNGAKFVNPTGLTSETIKSNIESLLKDNEFTTCLNQSI